MRSPALRYLLERLDLEPVAPGVFREPGGDDPLHRLFGGEVAAQALVAMGRTVAPDRPVHSLHTRFVRPGRTGVPIELHVTTVKEGRSFDLRSVELRQDGRLILTATASFQLPEPGPRYPDPAPAATDAESLPRWEERFGDRRDRLSPLWTRSRPIDLRYVDPPPPLDPALRDRPRRGQTTLVRADGPLPDDPLLHAAAVVYASDMTLLETALLPLGVVYADGEFDGVSLDHTMWFHRPPRADRWLRYEQTAEVMAGARGLASGRLSDENGELVVTVVQEGLLRPTGGAGSWLAGTAADRTMPEERR
ncbi:acyl-CoA thioesterase II [Amycolatopsis sp. FDAARGOS 1241]|uniref:acyl-CoA thioesterase n=1 Tax=Amycolatopsis sp. FDAARGOS 1241 TaxID=2778070 RepID=UPI00194EB542|nr:acyl-CoA thioesterase domain-containing protein [Amycolatopsis sp. FDAARGOS 1241]QRP43126.1 thioesterase family protein [Amycolatopsis sp. FDAARGOS 1241]